MEGRRLSRDLDVVVFGATGVAGRQVAAYLATSGASWGAAGRDGAKVDRVLGEIGVSAPETIAADLTDPDSLLAMASRTAVVLNLVGPYTIHGLPVIAACVDGGAHYADLTGEIPFVRSMIAEFDQAATEARVKIVEVCGFEALPPDLAVELAAEAARERYDAPLERVDVSIEVTGQPSGPPRLSDMISGGTLQSMAEVMGSPDAQVAADPAALIADPTAASAVRSRSPIELRPRRGRDGRVLAPMTPAAFINPAVIQRTAAVIAAERGLAPAPFAYREGVAIGGPSFTLPLRFGAAAMLSGMQYGVRTVARARPEIRERVAGGMRRVLPGSGFGPTGERLEQWRWRLTADGATASGGEVSVTLDAEGHPGYLATARMLGEAGLMMAEPGATPDRAGCVTPALALGTASIDRFERAGLHFTTT